MNLFGLKYLVVGSGFFGAVIAERIANDLGERVLVIEKRQHPGGNCYSDIDPESGIEYHKYGSHIFHTNNEAVWKYCNRFSTFNTYRHKVLTKHMGKIYQMPINLFTINEFYGTSFTPAQARQFIIEEISKEILSKDHSNLEDKAISQIGRPLYKALIKGYTAKQWETDPSQLSASIINRLPVRFNYNSDYFNDLWQGIPTDGYGALFNKLLSHPKIELQLNTDFNEIRSQIPSDCLVIYSGQIDQFFNYQYGTLGWRTLQLEMEVVQTDDYQGTSVMNYSDKSVPFTRIHEFKHYHTERNYSLDKTLICREYSKKWQMGDEAYYPVNTNIDKQVYNRYVSAAAECDNIIFGGRLGSYSYMDMDQVINDALDTYASRVKRHGYQRVVKD
jgi:UDP-galactopyranose mutase